MAVPFPKALERFPRLRQSWLSTYDNCALSSKFETEYEQGWSSHPAARGIISHRAIARCLTLMLERDEPYVPVDVALDQVDQVIRQADVGTDEPFGDEVVSIPVREIAEVRVTVKTWALYTSWAVQDFAGIEKRLETTLTYPASQGPVPGIPDSQREREATADWDDVTEPAMVERLVTGKLDLLLIEQDGEHAIVYDLKDTWGIPSERLGVTRIREDGPPENVSEEGYFQQRFYSLLVFRHYPRVQRVTLREFYPRYASGKVLDRKGLPINPVREATVDRVQLGDIEAEMSALIERFDRSYETGKFRPAPGSHCAYCVRPEACTIFPSAKGEGRISSPAEAERLAGRLNVLTALTKQTTKALRAWSNAHGDVRVRDAKRPRVYGPVVRIETKAPTAAQIRQAVERGDDPAELYRSREVVGFCVHTPEEVHPQVAAARREEEALLAMERAAAARRLQ
jgi:hypothetical protein